VEAPPYQSVQRGGLAPRSRTAGLAACDKDIDVSGYFELLPWAANNNRVCRGFGCGLVREAQYGRFSLRGRYARPPA